MDFTRDRTRQDEKWKVNQGLVMAFNKNRSETRTYLNIQQIYNIYSVHLSVKIWTIVNVEASLRRIREGNFPKRQPERFPERGCRYDHQYIEKEGGAESN